ncbi:hypothetical protein AAFC00_000225 [Neodothiora populina]|uniref:Uncharacterized protein n=1 Tax=Neodothiora populina TaxID=2781224 RepID=A0ABR3P1T9_9PEZI
MASFWLYKFPKSQFLESIPVQTSSFVSQTVIVTGSNTGLGFEAARQIAHLGASKLILACRTVATAEAAAAKIAADLGDKASKTEIEVWKLDISSFSSVKAFADRAKGLDRLDAVLQNAGAINPKFEILDESGEESNLMTLVTGPVLFGLLLLPILRASAKKTGSRGRLAYVGSDTHYIAQAKESQVADRPLFDAMNDPKIANMGNRYMTSKLLLYLAVKEIAARSPLSEDSNVIITVLTPGLCWSDLQRNASWAERIFMTGMLTVIARKTEVGGRTLVHGVTQDLGPEAHGNFLMDCKIGDEPDLSLQKRVADEIFPLMEKTEPGVTSCLNAKA